MHQPWRTFAVVINRYISRKSTGLDRLRPSTAQILWGMFYKANVDFVALLLLGTFKYVSKTEDYQKYGALTLERIINQAIKDSKEYKIYLAYATGAATPKKARKIKKPASPSKKQNLVLEDEPTKKPKQAKHPELGKKSAPTKEDVSSKKPLRKKSVGVVIRDTPGVSVSKKKATAKVDRARAWIYFLM
ncbi:hypothetical protein Tco_1225176 [Tanacetum coccineum]